MCILFFPQFPSCLREVVRKTNTHGPEVGTKTSPDLLPWRSCSDRHVRYCKRGSVSVSHNATGSFTVSRDRDARAGVGRVGVTGARGGYRYGTRVGGLEGI